MRTSLAPQLNLPMPPPYATPRIGMIACFICGRPISVWVSRTKSTYCRECTAVHNLTWTGGTAMPKFTAIVDVPGTIPKEYLERLNIPVGADEEGEDDESSSESTPDDPAQ